MHDRLTKIQLGIFAVITALTLSVMAIFYLRLSPSAVSSRWG
jgi:phospholipid/cholesterol/gamma-HCH transport system substrate-binding protein